MLNKNKSTSAFSLSTFNDVLPVQNEQDTHDTQGIQDTHITQHTHDTQDTQDTQKKQPFLKRKQKYPRINMAFHDIEYLREIAYQNRMTQTEYVNYLLEEDKRKRMEDGTYVKKI